MILRLPAQISIPAGSTNATGTTFDNYGAASNHTLVTVTSSGISAGTVQLQGSLDAANWVNLLGSPITLAASSTQTAGVQNVPFQFLRAVSSGVVGGTVQAWVASAH
jgi:hypothetical protein